MEERIKSSREIAQTKRTQSINNHQTATNTRRALLCMNSNRPIERARFLWSRLKFKNVQKGDFDSILLI